MRPAAGGPAAERTPSHDLLASQFATLSSEGFRTLAAAPFGSEDNTFYTGALTDGTAYVVKVFADPTKFDNELRALGALQDSGRVCGILFDSTRLPVVVGQPFIIKPFYPISLPSDADPLRLLEIFAQEVDISKKLLAQGWRDYDGRLNNDALHDGRVIRIDLDAAQRHTFRGHPKFQDEFHTPWQCAAFENVTRTLRGLFTEAAEIDSLTLRFTLFLFSRLPASPPAEQIGVLIKALLARRDTPSWRTTWRARTARTEWHALFQHLASADAGLGVRLTAAEASGVAALFHHVLTTRGHDFGLTDLYLSLMLDRKSVV